MKKLIALLALAAVLVVLVVWGWSATPRRALTPVYSSIHAPHSARMLVTIPELGIKNVPTEDAPASDESALTNGLMHVHGTGFPWQPGANVYLAGHDLGWPGTRSWHIFWHLRDLEPGDRIYITDAKSRRFTYKVYRQYTVGPHHVQVMAPTGRSIVTLQTCTPHWTWTKRLIVRGELVKVEHEN